MSFSFVVFVEVLFTRGRLALTTVNWDVHWHSTVETSSTVRIFVSYVNVLSSTQVWVYHSIGCPDPRPQKVGKQVSSHTLSNGPLNTTGERDSETNKIN